MRWSFVAAVVVATAIGAGVASGAEPAFVGLQVQGLNERAAQALGLDRKDGAVVFNVAVGSPAAAAGFERGDVVLTVAGKPVASFESLLLTIGGLSAGDKVPVTVLRRGATVSLSLETKPWPQAWRVTRDSVATIPGLGITMAAATPKVREAFALRWGMTGVVVTLTDVAQMKFHDLQRGEVIVQVNQDDVWMPEQIVDAFTKAKANKRKDLLLVVEGANGFRLSLLPVQ